jgi:ubiquinone/menaquinone biosynthesis C-methylase UbiE
MEPGLQRRVQRYGWDKASLYYENSWQAQLKPAQDKLLFFANIQPGEKIIDIACGTGLVSFRALEAAGENGFVLGVDISDRMVETANETAKKINLTNVQFTRMDAEELKTRNDEYDVSICALGLMYIPDPINALKEMRRVLKPGGRCVVAVWGKRSNCGWAEIFGIVDKRVSSDVCPMFFNLGTNDMLQRSMHAAGFSKIQVEPINTLLHYDSGEQACAAAFAGGPVALPYFKFSDIVKKEVHAEYLASIDSYKKSTTYLVPGEFVIAIGFK